MGSTLTRLFPRDAAIARRPGWADVLALASALFVLGVPPRGFAQSLSGRPVTSAVALGQNAVDGPVWAVARAAGGELVVGSNRLAILEGDHWTPVDVPGAYAFRALAPAVAARRVWVGGVNTLGYLEPDGSGRWQYHSLLAQWQRHGAAALDDLWAVQPAGDGAIWVGSQRVIRWDGIRFKHWDLPAPTHLLGFPAADAMWFYREGHGLFRLSSLGDPQLILAEGDFPAAPVTWLIPPTPDRPDLLFGTVGGAYRRDPDGRLQRLDELSSALKDALPGQALRIEHGLLAITTFRAGVILADDTGRVRERLDRERGLPDNTIYALTAERDRLWIGSGSGLTRADGVGHTTLIDRSTGLGNGVPRAVRFTRDGVWVLTSTDLLRLTPAGPRPVPGLEQETLLWTARQHEDALWVGGFGGVWRSDDARAERVHHVSADVMRLTPSQAVPDGLLFLEGYALKTLRPSPHGGWSAHELGLRAGDTPTSLHEAADGNVWVGTMSGGIELYGWRQSVEGARAQLRLLCHFREKAGLPANAYRARIVELGGRIFAFTDAGILALSPDGRSFTAEPSLRSFVGIAAAPAAPDGTGFWLVQPRVLSGSGSDALVRVRVDGEGVSVEPIEAHGLGAVGQAVALDYGAGAVWLSGTDGVLRIHEGSLRPASSPAEVSLKPLLADDGRATPTVSHDGVFILPPRVRRVEFRVSAFDSGSGSAYLQTRLAGVDDDWSVPSGERARIFSGLAPGAYCFEARAVDAFGRAGPISRLAFVLRAPWYFRPLAVAAYTGLILLLIVGVVRWRMRRLKLQNERLNRLVAERTRELALSNAAKSEFLEDISHEIRNPLNGLTGLLALLKEDNLGPRERDLTRSLRAVAGNLKRVFEDVLGFSKLEYGYVTVQPRPFALRALLDEVVALFALTARQQGCAVAVAWPPELVDGFAGDDGKIKTIVGNFLGNALKYAPGAPVELRVLAGAQTDDAVELFIEVSDHGPGVPTEEQELIFNKFVRGSRAKRDRIAGTGLGLAACRALAQLMGGNVGLHSSPGAGSTFFLGLHLPRAPIAAAAAPTNGSDTSVATAPVLIVEDEHYNQVVLEGISLELGYEPDLTASAQEALGRLKTRAYEVIFLDWELPDAKGGQVAQAVRARADGDRPIILATTAHDSEEIRMQCRAAGMDGFLLKPYDVETVRGMIATVRARRAGHGRAFEDTGVGPVDDRLNFNAFLHYARAKQQDAATAVQRFITAIDQESAALHEAMSVDDAEAITVRAHRLRALGGLIGAQELNTAAVRLEQLARTGPAEVRAAGAQAVQAACTALKLRLRNGTGG